MNSEEFLIGELAEKAGVSVRTIRYYISEGLLPSPETRGRYTVYDEDYLKRIDLIKRLKDAYLPIREIRTMLETKTQQEIEEFLSHYEVNRPSTNSALEYLSGVMEKGVDPYIIAESRPYGGPQSPRARRDNRERGSNPLDDPNGVRWRRISIQPGVEIHIDEQIFFQKRGIIFKIVEAFKDALRKDGPQRS